MVTPQQVEIPTVRPLDLPGLRLFGCFFLQVLAHLNRLSSWAHSYVRARESQDSGLDFMYTDLARFVDTYW